MKKLSRALEPDLWLEMMLDLATIYGSLWSLLHLGHFILPGGWLTAWLWTVRLLEEDSSLYCVSAWNDQVSKGFSHLH